MPDAALGLGLSGATLVMWSLSPFFFAAAGRRIGAYATNLMRLALAFPVLAVLAVTRMLTHAGTHAGAGAWLWLSLSGAVGLALGDFFLYRSLVQQGPERTSQFMTLAPALTAALAWTALHERLSPAQLAGMALVLAGVSLATWTRRRAAAVAPPAEAPPSGAGETGKPASYLASGAWAGVWSAVCQAIGTVFTRQAFLGQADLDPWLATALRVGAGSLILWTAASLLGPLPRGLARWRDRSVMKRVLAGTLAGPVVGMLCYVSALKYTAAGIVTTITFMGPLLIIPLGAWRYGTRITARAAAGTLVSLAGVALLGLG